jgi:uncharacterized membrane protein YfcA
VTVLALCVFAFLAGFVDSVVGGGLIQLPALLLLLPPDLTRDVATVLGTNKAASIWGTAMAVTRYAPRVRIPWSSILPSALAAFVSAWLGARTVAHLQRATVEPLILVLLVGVAIYTAVRPDVGRWHAPAFTAHRERSWGVLVGGALGFYDGFFGPGMGSFLIFVFIGVFGFDFLTASASAKVINVATNLAALLLFAFTGHVLYRYAWPMAAAQIGGSMAGTHTALAHGNRFIRTLFLIVALVLIARFAVDVFA